MVLASALDIFSRDGFSFLSRWSHVLVGITWIGLLYFFNFVQVPAFAEMEAAARNNAIDKLTSRALWWFRWAAAATLVTGIALLCARSEGARIRATTWKSAPGMAISAGILLAVTMFLNVWLVIWPNQKKVIANARNVQAGGEADPTAAPAGRKARWPRGRTRSSRSRCWCSWSARPTSRTTSFDSRPEARGAIVLDHLDRDLGRARAQRARADRRNGARRHARHLREPSQRDHHGFVLLVW